MFLTLSNYQDKMFQLKLPHKKFDITMCLNTVKAMQTANVNGTCFLTLSFCTFRVILYNVCAKLALRVMECKK